MNHPESSDAQENTQRDDTTSATFMLPYRSLLLAPTVSLAGNPIDRHDVETAAILGYN
ncbi:hypothetical protein LMG28688_06345 [Paraburkholderia caffeinitolerans]|uniref:Uncharacterized protein n=1 Tax=Paraburkholderia caffeinitolerans TaxID=1723730 RepID=A0A6J5GV91_9BURK|nr:hypothetical protein [Paraburkholderia caffeinitolerans]CAB3806366.1 hypothetical protein LMG28688_06345 [Paraburkholderia caffeinitolerans]